jgi:Transposase IS116/IS110/IS902 family
MTHPGVGPHTALAYVLIIGTPSRFPRGKQIGHYVGMIPSEAASNGLDTQQGRKPPRSCWMDRLRNRQVDGVSEFAEFADHSRVRCCFDLLLIAGPRS